MRFDANDCHKRASITFRHPIHKDRSTLHVRCRLMIEGNRFILVTTPVVMRGV